jgi:hypothetical protein
MVSATLVPLGTRPPFLHLSTQGNNVTPVTAHVKAKSDDREATLGN